MNQAEVVEGIEQVTRARHGQQCLVQLSPKGGAVLSEDKAYRYALHRQWSQRIGTTVCFIGLNPSTADGFEDDATIRRCTAFARSWGHVGLIMVNLFAFRATSPRVMKEQAEPVGFLNDQFIASMCSRSDFVIACWGTQGTHLDRDCQVAQLVGNRMHALRLTQGGFPEHPLYLGKSVAPFPVALTHPRYGVWLSSPRVPVSTVLAERKG